MLQALRTKNRRGLLVLTPKDAFDAIEMTFSELARHWQRVTFRNLKATTADHYAKVLRAYLVPFSGQRTIATITRNEVQEFPVEQSNHYSRSGVHEMKIALILVMGHALENEWLKKNPACHIKSPSEEYCRL